MITKISLSGQAGSGKSTVGKIIAQKLGYEFISVGNFVRKLAREQYNMDVYEFQKYLDQHPEIDNSIDERFAKYCNGSQKLVIDYRLAFRFVKDCFHVYIDVDLDEAVRRLYEMQRTDIQGKSKEEVKKMLKERNNRTRNRFKQIYGVDIDDTSNYDFVIKTHKDITPEQIAEKILSEYKQFQTVKI